MVTAVPERPTQGHEKQLPKVLCRKSLHGPDAVPEFVSRKRLARRSYWVLAIGLLNPI